MKRKPHVNEFQYSKQIEDRVREGILHGLSLQVIFDSLENHSDRPTALSGFTKKYKSAIGEARYEFQKSLAEKAKDRIENDSDKILELALKSKAGWNPNIRIEDVENDELDENKDPIRKIIEMLGKNEDN
jgi:hypothetical protein